MNSDFDVVPVRPYPSTLGLIGTVPSWLVMNQMLGEQAMTLSLTQLQDLNCLLVSGDGSLDCHQCMILTKLASFV